MLFFHLLLLTSVSLLVYAIDFRSTNYRHYGVVDQSGSVGGAQQLANPYSAIFAASPDFPMLQNSFSTPDTTTTNSPTTTTITTTTPSKTVWTTSKTPLKLSKISKPSKNGQGSKPFTSFGSAQLSVLSHRLLNDVLIIPSSRRLYILAILPIHQSANNQNFECGEIDVNAIIRMSSFLESLKKINDAPTLREIGADLGAIVLDSCSTDLRSVADLYELLSGTNIQRSDLIAIIRDDSTFMPNTEHILEQLNLPVINTFFTPNTLPKTTGTVPSMILPIQSIVAALQHYHSNCVNLVFDANYQHSSNDFQRIAAEHQMCIEVGVDITNFSPEEVVRRLLLSEARIVVALLSEHTWIQLVRALRSEMVIANRFVFVALQDQKWSTSQKFIESWPTFEQSLVSVALKTPINHQDEIHQLATSIPNLTLPNVWLKQFWASAFHCHVESDEESGAERRFSKECATSQTLNITKVAPSVDVSSISIAAHSVGIAFRQFVDRHCPGALVISLSDCINDPFTSFHQSIVALDFVHHLSDSPIYFNYTTGYRDVPLQINRVQFDDHRLQFTELGIYDPILGYRDSFASSEQSTNTSISSRGSYLLMSSTCPASKCAREFAKLTIRQQLPSILKALTDIEILVFTIFSVLSSLTCLMCMYLKVISTCEHKNCSAVCFLGLAFLSLSSPAFITPPNTISCALRNLLFPISFAITMAPVFVKTILLWKYKLSELRSNNSIYVTCSIIAIQTVISIEWVVLSQNSATDFVSTIHGTMWRCSPGDAAESQMLTSCSAIAILSIVSFLFSLASLKQSDSLQHLIISIMALLFETSLYVSLPLLSYRMRDIVMATAILVFSFLVLLISHVNRSNNDSSSECATLQKNEHWIQQVSLQTAKHYHTASTLARNPTDSSTNSDPTTLRRTSCLYGVEGYEQPPSTNYA